MVRSFLDASTAHVSKAAVEWLKQASGGFTVAEFAYGWILIVPQCEVDTAHPDLQPICDFANKQGCHHILFDRDAPTIEGIATYEW